MSEARDVQVSMDDLSNDLLDIRQQMRAAFEQGRWQDLADLDKQCRSSIASVAKTKDRELFLLLNDTLRFYRKLLSEFHSHKSNISSEVLQLRRAQSSDQVYRQMSVVR